MARTLVTIEGLKDLEAALSDLPNSTARSVLVRALKKAGQPLADHAKQLVPVRTGHLRDSIVVASKVRNLTGLAEYGQTLRAGGTRDEARQALRDERRSGTQLGSRATIEVGTASPVAHLQELGTIKMAAHPFMRPAYEADKTAVLASISSQLKAEIDKAVARAERKAARLLAKG
jgi:HK97 gp10 family phage protein